LGSVRGFFWVNNPWFDGQPPKSALTRGTIWFLHESRATSTATSPIVSASVNTWTDWPIKCGRTPLSWSNTSVSEARPWLHSLILQWPQACAFPT
jgi:hypothetical protein